MGGTREQIDRFAWVVRGATAKLILFWFHPPSLVAFLLNQVPGAAGGSCLVTAVVYYLMPGASFGTIFMIWLGCSILLVPLLSFLYFLFARRTVELFQTQRELNKAYPLEDSLERGEELYCLWLTGVGVYKEIAVEKKHLENIKELILLHPDCLDNDNVSAIENELKDRQAFFDLKKQVESVTEFARKHKTTVYWRKTIENVNLTFGNPHGMDGWLHVGLLLPTKQPRRRQFFRILKKKNPKAFDELWENYQAIRDKAECLPALTIPAA